MVFGSMVLGLSVWVVVLLLFFVGSEGLFSMIFFISFLIFVDLVDRFMFCFWEGRIGSVFYMEFFCVSIGEGLFFCFSDEIWSGRGWRLIVFLLGGCIFVKDVCFGGGFVDGSCEYVIFCE